jgi:hypothetical protein
VGRKIDFEESTDFELLTSLLNVQEGTSGTKSPYPEWEILHELDRQQRRRDYEKSPARLAVRREKDKVRRYVTGHPELIEQFKEKV